MSDLLEFKTEAGGSVLIEVDEPHGPITRGGRAQAAVLEATDSLEQVLARLGPAVRGIVTKLRATADWPDEVDVEFGVKLSADSSVIIVRAGGEANFRIALKWSASQTDG